MIQSNRVDGFEDEGRKVWISTNEAETYRSERGSIDDAPEADPDGEHVDGYVSVGLYVTLQLPVAFALLLEYKSQLMNSNFIKKMVFFCVFFACFVCFVLRFSLENGAQCTVETVAWRT
jgi:hypothetical protein